MSTRPVRTSVVLAACKPKGSAEIAVLGGMAKETFHQELQCITLSRQEAVNLIGLLSAQLGDVALRGNHMSACFDAYLHKQEGDPKRLVIALEPDE